VYANLLVYTLLRWKVVRDAWCLEVMHRAFTGGLMQYGMMTASKKPAPPPPPPAPPTPPPSAPASAPAL